MEKTYKRIPFNIELAKNIQSGEIEGKIVCRIGCPARILCTDFNDEQGTFAVVVAIKENPVREKLIRVRTDGTYSAYESDMDLFIELPEEQHPIEESELYQAGYKVGFEAGKCVTFDEKKGCVIKKETPKHEFKPFDKVKIHLAGDRYDNWIATVVYVHGNLIGVTVNNHHFVFYDSNNIELVEPYEEKHEFKPFDKVLVREDDLTNWQAAFFSHIESFEDGERFAITTSGDNYNLANNEIIPYEGNEHFVGTTDKPKEE